MKSMFSKILLLSFVALGSSQASADESYTTSDVVGMFAGETFTGPLANTKTVMQAHLLCMGVGGDQSTNSNSSFSYESEYSTSYKNCMADYVPFRVTGSDESGACLSESVTWGMCSSTLPTGSEGSVYSVRNDALNDMYEGVASFQCVNSVWQYGNGGCARSAQPCEAGLITSWDVTSPTWADQDSSTVYTDRFGQQRHDPQSGCYARMGSASSGELVYPVPTSPETSPASSYNLTDSSSPQRCFDNEWIDDPTGGSTNCEFVPDDCSATTYTHPNGCSFSIPSLDHDEIFTNSNPSPSLSTGSVQAYCWNGNVEVKSSSCNKSCASDVSANIWDWDYEAGEVDPRRCAHNALNTSARIAPSGSLTMDNTTEGLTGKSVYACSNGTLTLESETCYPESCTAVPANSWSSGETSCSHDAFVIDLAHNESTAKRTVDIQAGTEGIAQYTCRYGEVGADSLSCSPGLISASYCYAEEVNPDDPGNESPGPVDPGIDRCENLLHYYQDNNQCCRSYAVGEAPDAPKTVCYLIP